MIMAEDDNNEELDIVELDESLGDAEKPPEVTPGVYEGDVQDVQTKTSGKGNRYYAVKFVIPEGKLPADIREHYPDGAVFFYNRIIVPQRGDRRAMYNLKVFMEALGLDTNTTTIDPNEWMNQTARLRIVHERYQGENRAQIKSVEKAEASAPRPASRGEPAKKEAVKPRGRGR